MDPDKVTEEDAQQFQALCKGVEEDFYRFIRSSPKAALNNLKRLMSRAQRMSDFLDETEEDDNGSS